MTFLASWAAWFLAGVPVIVLLYLLKLKRRPLTVSTLLFWERVMEENRQRALFQKLRHLLSLLLHLLIFLLIVAALAKPAIDRLVRDGASTVLVIDLRARMQATVDGGETRFAKALAAARKYAREAGAGRQIAMLSAGASPHVVVPFTSDERALLDGLESLTPTDAAGDLNAALTLADSLLASRKGDAQIVVFSDALPATAQPRSRTSLVPCGATARDNIAITRFATRPSLTSPQTSEVLLAIKNFGTTKASGNVEIAFDGKPLDVKPFALDPGQERLDIFPAVPRTARSARGWLTAKIDTPDALSSDNIAYAVLPLPQPRRVLLVSKGNWFLEKLLDADQQVKFELIGPDAWQADFAEKFDAVIFDDFLPAGLDLAKDGGNFLFLKRSPFSTGDAPIEQPLISDLDTIHPLLRLVSLQNVTIVRSTPTKLPESADGWTWQAPLKSFEHPLLIAGTRRQQRVAALAFDLAESDLPLRIAFPLLMSNTVHWLAGEAAESAGSLTAGSTLPLPAGASIFTTPLSATGAEPDPTKTAIGDFQPLTNGFYKIAQPTGVTWLAVNTFNAAESDLRSSTSAEPGTASLPAATLAGFAWPLWQYLALAAFVLIAVEWWLFHRRRTE